MLEETAAIQEAAKMTKSAPSGAKALRELFPGIAIRSTSKAEKSVTDDILGDIEKIASKRGELGLSDEFVAEFMADVVRRHGRSENFKSVLAFAEPLIRPEARPEDVDRGWAEDFRDHAEKAFDEEARRTWAALLANEINEPGAFSRRTMSMLSEMSAEDAATFRALCSACVFPLDSVGNPTRPIPVNVGDGNGSTLNYGSITFSGLSNMEALGVISYSVTSSFDIKAGDEVDVMIGDQVVSVVKGDPVAFEHGFTPLFTKWGLELLRLCEGDVGKLPGLRELFKKTLADSGLTINEQEE